MSEQATGFRAGFSARHDAAAAALGAAFALPTPFEAFDLRASPRPKGFAPAPEGGPRHFTPLDPERNPTEGWDPLDPSLEQGDGGGFVDPIAAARAAGHAEGVAATMAQTAADCARDRALAEALGDALGKGVGFDRERIARQLRQTVLLLVERLVGEVGIAPDTLAARIEAAVDILADSAESALLRLNPDDVALVADRLPKTLFPVGDPMIARGSFVLESASTIVEDGPDHWLGQLAAAIDRVAVPLC